MTTRSAILSFVLDQLDGIDDISSRPMFGGIGLYFGAVFFGIIFKDILYLKVDAQTRADYERAGMKPFTPYTNRATTMQYYEVPAGVLENSENLTAWARKAIAAAERSASRKTSRAGTASSRRRRATKR
jgi:DNA transformation protein